MRFAIWQTFNYADCALGYKPGAPMRKVWSGKAEWSSDMELEEVLDPIWRQFQRVDENHMPPEGYRGRSVSIGDVIQLIAEDDDAMEAWWTPKFGVGWEEVEPVQDDGCPDCNNEWPIELHACPSCGLTMEDIAERLTGR